MTGSDLGGGSRGFIPGGIFKALNFKIENGL